MARVLNRTTTVTGIAIFSMFFGAGNTVFPLILGQTSGDMLLFAFMGLLITAIGGPVLGLTGSLLYKGKARKFFSPVGPLLGNFFLAACLALLGPFAVLPRCIIVANAALSQWDFSINTLLFTTIFSALSLFASIRQKSLINLLGYVLSPLLIICLLCIIGIAFVTAEPLLPSNETSISSFSNGLLVGYDTLDMIAAIIFASSIWMLLKDRLKGEGDPDPAVVTRTAIISGLIGGVLLGFIYVGLSFSAAFHATSLVGVAYEELLPRLATSMLGAGFGSVANIAVCLACFTTVVSLMCSLTAIIDKEILKGRVSRERILFAMSVITWIFANASFGSIMSVVHPVITVCYPAIILLTIYNICHYYFGWKQQKKMIYAVTFIALMALIKPTLIS